MTIIELILQKVKVVRTEPGGVTAEEVGRKAAAATLGGLGSAGWQEYMQMFAETPEQLARLTSLSGGANAPDMQRALAYLVASGVVGVDTFLKLEKNQQALSILDDILPDARLSGDSTKIGKP
jgi:hypothetical protein